MVQRQDAVCASGEPEKSNKRDPEWGEVCGKIPLSGGVVHRLWQSRVDAETTCRPSRLWPSDLEGEPADRLIALDVRDEWEEGFRMTLGLGAPATEWSVS